MLTVLVFACTWVLIAARRLRWLPIGRPGGALAGAVGMVVVGAISPEQSWLAINHDTIALLFGMMALSAYVAEAGGFERVAGAVLSRCRTGWSVLMALSLTAALLSALLVNDTVCVFLTPVVLSVCRRARLPFGPFLIALATSANLGSAATAVGNPQNMLIAGLAQMPFSRFLLLCGPAAALCVALNALLLWRAYGARLAVPVQAQPVAPVSPAQRAALLRVGVVLGGVIIAFLADLHLGYTALGATTALMLWERRDPARILAKIDWSLLVFFCCLFIVVAGFDATGLPSAAWAAAEPWIGLGDPAGVAAFTLLNAVGANIVSNVPMVMLVGPHLAAAGLGDAGWAVLAFVLTVAGNLTLVGSVANIIVAESAAADYELGFKEYLAFGLPSTLLCLAAGVPLVLMMAAI